ncbi:MAG: NmrA/HSCARG family protein [Chloroflexi bacterium]|nr:NmrA/HSCARG family protein [Chloroflexota bacterium]
MALNEKSVLVLGATGRQGGATARHLLAKGWIVRALVRDPGNPAITDLQQAGAQIVRGDFDDWASLDAAMQGVYGVFSVQASVDEVRQGKSIADAAKAASIQHFIFTSVQSAEDFARTGGDSNKWEIEQYVQSLGLPYTILRPCLFMDDLFSPRYGGPEGTFAIAFAPDVPIGLIASDDIGAFAALAFEYPEEYLGKTIEIAGDVLTPLEIAATISQFTGREFPYIQIPIETLRQQNAKIARAFEYLNEVGYTTNIEPLRKKHPGLMELNTWLHTDHAARALAAI